MDRRQSCSAWRQWLLDGCLKFVIDNSFQAISLLNQALYQFSGFYLQWIEELPFFCFKIEIFSLEHQSQCIFVFILFILISLFCFFYLFHFQLSNGFYHCSLSSDPSVASVGAGPFPHFPPVSRAWTRAPSALLPDYVHYYTIGPGMLPSSKIPSWKVCVPFVVAVLTSSYQQHAHSSCCSLSVHVITGWFALFGITLNGHCMVKIRPKIRLWVFLNDLVCSGTN